MDDYEHEQAALVGRLRDSLLTIAQPGPHQAIQISPEEISKSAEYHRAATAARAAHKYEAALANMECALAVNPEDIALRSNYTEYLMATGQAQKALKISGDLLGKHPFAPSNYMFAADYCGVPNAKRASIREYFGQRLPLRSCTWDGHRKINLGLMCSDDNFHPVGFFLQRILAAIDRDKFRIILFSDEHRSDDLSAAIDGQVDYRIDTRRHNGRELIAIVDIMHIDCLVDMGGHTNGGIFLQALSRHVAPLQITAIGYPNATALDCFDFKVGSAICREDHAAGNEPLWENPAGYAPVFSLRRREVVPEINRRIHGGVIATPGKISDADLRWWSSLLDQYPIDISLCRFDDQITSAMAGRCHEIDPRLGIIRHPRSDYATMLTRFDFILDTTVWSGHVTTIEALSHGLPVFGRPVLPTTRSRLTEEVYRCCGMEAPTIDMVADREKLLWCRSEIYKRMSEIDTTAAWTKALENKIVETLSGMVSGIVSV